VTTWIWVDVNTNLGIDASLTGVDTAAILLKY